MRYYQAAILTLAALLFNGCIFQQQQQQQKGSESNDRAEKVAENPPLYLGTVHQVYPEQKFVLLRIIGPMPAPGTTLITHPPDGSLSRLGNICITTEKATRNGIVAADVRAGAVLRGDRVFLYRDVSSHSPREEENPVDSEADDVTNAPPSPLPVGEESLENEHPRIINTPIPERGADIPDPVVSDSEDDTTIEQMPSAPISPADEPSVPVPSGSPGTAPSYLDEIPDDIKDWN